MNIKHWLLMLTISFIAASCTQEWVESNAEWHISHDPGFTGGCFPCNYGYETWNYTGDTIIDGKNCQVLSGTLNYASYNESTDEYLYDQFQVLNNKHIFHSSNDTTWYVENGVFVIYAILDAFPGDRWTVTEEYAGEAFDVVVDSTYFNDFLGLGLRGLWVHFEREVDGEVWQSDFPYEILERRYHGNQLRPIDCPPDLVCDPGVLRRFLCFSSDSTALVQLEDDCTPLLTSLSDYQKTRSLEIFPNPIAQHSLGNAFPLRVRMPSDRQVVALRLVDMAGRVAECSFRSTSYAEMQELEVQLPSVSSGTYALQLVTQDEEMFSGTLIVQ